MQKVKFFKSIESEIKSLETQINDWLAESNARVISITGNIAPQSESRSESGSLGIGGSSGTSYVPSDILVVILYETT